MEKINIAELLKDCPKGMELDCMMYENVYFDSIKENYRYPVRCYTITDDGVRNTIEFSEYGNANKHSNAKCVIFPKGKTTWEGFQRPFKEGDVLVSRTGNIVLCSHIDDSQVVHYHCILSPFGGLTIRNDIGVGKSFQCTLATDAEKQRLFDKLKSERYKYNPQTNRLEKLIIPKFKVGDVIQDKDGYKVKITEVNIEDECYGYESMIAKGIGGIGFSEQDNWKLVPNKFDISTLKPFNKVLVRDSNKAKWVITFFSHCNNYPAYKYSCIHNTGFAQCVPYESNEHLLNTTNDCDDYYKTWE